MSDLSYRMDGGTMLQLPDIDDRQANPRQVALSMHRVNITRMGAVTFARQTMQYIDLDLSGLRAGGLADPAHINSTDWEFTDSMSGGFLLLKQDAHVGDTVSCRYLFLPGVGEVTSAEYWELLDGRLPLLEFYCDRAWHTASGRAENRGIAAKVNALVMAQLAILVPNAPWPPTA